MNQPFMAFFPLLLLCPLLNLNFSFMYLYISVYMFGCTHVLLSSVCTIHTFVFVISIASTWALLVCYCVCLCASARRALAQAGGGTCLAASAPSCSSSDAIVWFKEPEGADRLAARKVKITILLLKTAYIVALQVHLSVPAPWLSAWSQTPNARAGSPPPAASVLWCYGSCLLQRMHVYCLPDIL